MCLLALVVASVYYYGYRALCVVAISVVTCYATDVLCIFLRKQKYVFKNPSPIILGIVFALLMPASISYYTLITACVLMIVIGKQVFGGIDNQIFQPVAVGYAIASICWSASVLMYTKPMPLSQLPITQEVTQTQYHSLTYALNQGSIPFVSQIDILLGRFEGPMGTTHIAILAMCALVLMCRKIIPWQTVLTALAVIVGGGYLFPNAFRMTTTQSILFDVISGAGLFILLFVACDRALLPKNATGKTLYGILIGLLTIVFRKYALVEQGMIYAVIIANVLASTLDSLHPHFIALFKSMKTWPKKFVMLIIFIFKSFARLLVFVVKKLFALIKKMTIKKALEKSNDEETKEIESNEQADEVLESSQNETTNPQKEEVIEETAQPIEEEPEQTELFEVEKPKPKRKRSANKKSKQPKVAEVQEKNYDEIQQLEFEDQEIKDQNTEPKVDIKQKIVVETTQDTSEEVSEIKLKQNSTHKKSKENVDGNNEGSKEIQVILKDTPLPKKRNRKKQNQQTKEEKILVATTSSEEDK